MRPKLRTAPSPPWRPDPRKTIGVEISINIDAGSGAHPIHGSFHHPIRPNCHDRTIGVNRERLLQVVHTIEYEPQVFHLVRASQKVHALTYKTCGDRSLSPPVYDLCTVRVLRNVTGSFQ